MSISKSCKSCHQRKNGECDPESKSAKECRVNNYYKWTRCARYYAEEEASDHSEDVEDVSSDHSEINKGEDIPILPPKSIEKVVIIPKKQYDEMKKETEALKIENKRLKKNLEEEKRKNNKG